MKNATDTLSILKHELEFLNSSGYRTPVGSRQPLFCMETSVAWRQALIFQDSPSCPKKRYCACDSEANCALKGFAPIEHRHDTIPCRHILLNESGETIDSLYKTGTNEEIEAAVRNWLMKTIEDFEKAAAREEDGGVRRGIA